MLLRNLSPMIALWVAATLIALPHQSHSRAAERLEIQPLQSGVESSFRGLAMRGANEVWATGSKGVVIRSLDGGKSWTRAAITGADADAEFRDVELLGGKVVVLLAVGEGGKSRVFRSADRGATWKTVLVNQSPKGFFDGVAFDSSGKRGMLYGDPVEGRVEVYRTADGGATWERSRRKQRPMVNDGEYGFAASGSGIAIRGGGVWIATGGSTARVFHSPDFGETWTGASTPIRSGNPSSGIFSIDLLDAKRGVAIGGDYLNPDESSNNLAVTNDGGRTWTAPKIAMPHKACVKYLSDERLLACGRTGVAISHDDGKSWKHVSGDRYFVMGWNRQAEVGFLAGPEGRVARVHWKSD